MAVITGSLSLNTHGNTDLHEITDEVGRLVGQSGLKSGLVTIFCPSSTSALTTVEFESGCIHDLKRMFDELVPAGRPYDHNNTWDDGNGHSHMRASLLGPSLSVPFVDGKLTLGTWQQIIYVDFDIRPRHRELVVQIMGE
jgi:secondary thiamine-phosphate synthase enzyme